MNTNDCTQVVAPDDSDRLAGLVESLPPRAVLCFRPGLYKAHLWIRRSITLQALEGEVVIDAEQELPTIVISESSADIHLEGLTLRDGFGGMGNGGNLSILHANNVVLRRCTIEGGEGDGGGAIYAHDGNLQLEQCRIRRNRGKRAQAILIESIVQGTIKNCLIADNEGPSTTLRVMGPAHLQLENSTLLSSEGSALQVNGRGFDAPTVQIVESIVSKVEIQAPGPAPKVVMTRSAVTEWIEGIEDGGDNRVGPLHLDSTHRPLAGSTCEGRGARL